jgi:hypothetical protein
MLFLSNRVGGEQSGAGTGNTALVFHAKKLLALHEGDLPYAVWLRLVAFVILFTFPVLGYLHQLVVHFTLSRSCCMRVLCGIAVSQLRCVRILYCLGRWIRNFLV